MCIPSSTLAWGVRAIIVGETKYKFLEFPPTNIPAELVKQ